MKKIKFFLYFYAPILIWMTIIFSLSAIPGNGAEVERSVWFYLQRKGAHVFEYLILTLLLVRLFKFHKVRKWETNFFSAIISLLYAYTDEFHQLFVPQREGKLMDVGVDSVGIALALILYSRIKRKVKPILKEVNFKKRQ